MDSAMLKTLNTQLTQIVSDAQTLRAEMEKRHKEAGDKEYENIADDRAKLIQLADRGHQLRVQIDAIRKLDETIDFATEKAEEKTVQSFAPARIKTIGQLVIESQQFKEAASSGELKRVEVKDLLESNTGGFLVQPDKRGPYMLPVLPVSILDVILMVPTTSNLVELVVETPTANTAAWVAEGALKPKNEIEFAETSVPILLLAKYVCASRQILQDAPRLRSYIDQHLRSRLRQKLGQEILTGAGGAGNMTGLLIAAGTQQRTQETASNGMGATGDTIFDTLRFAIADLQLAGFVADVIVLNPVTAALMETTKNTQGNYLMMFDPVIARLWRVTIIEDVNIPLDKALVMDRSMSAELYIRNWVEIYTGQPNDYFLRNLFAILGELRAGLGMPYPKGIVEVTLS